MVTFSNFWRIIVYAKTFSFLPVLSKHLFVVIIFMGIISSLSLLVMASNKSDAEAINISGSLRMQSYRLLTEMERSPNTVEQNLVRYQDSLNANVLLTVQNQLFAPFWDESVLSKNPSTMVSDVRFRSCASNRKISCRTEKLCTRCRWFSCWNCNALLNKKWISAVSVLCVSMLLILAMVSYVIWYMKREVVKPLELMTKASMQVQMGQFKHIQLDTESGNELWCFGKSVYANVIGIRATLFTFRRCR